MPGHDIIVVGASAGGVEALTQLISNLPSDLPAAIFIVLHIAPAGTSVLPKILNRAIEKRHKGASLRAIHPQDGEAIQPGQIYVALPDQHLLVKAGHIRLARGPAVCPELYRYRSTSAKFGVLLPTIGVALLHRASLC